MHFLKEGQKIRAWVDPPSIIRAMPERKRFFSIEVFPYNVVLRTGKKEVHNRDVPSINIQSNRQGCFLGETIHLHVNDWGRQSC